MTILVPRIVHIPHVAFPKQRWIKTNRNPPDTSITTAGVSVCRAAPGTDTVRHTVTQEQRQPAGLHRVGHPLFSTAGMPAVQHSTMRSRGTHVTSV